MSPDVRDRSVRLERPGHAGEEVLMKTREKPGGTSADYATSIAYVLLFVKCAAGTNFQNFHRNGKFAAVRGNKPAVGVDFMESNPYNKMEYEYGLLIRCSRLPQSPFEGQAAVQKKRGQTPRDRHCERKNVSEAASAAGRKLRHCRTGFCEKVRYERGA